MRSRILYISGSQENANQLARILKGVPSLALDHAGSLQQARGQLQTATYDVIITEAHLTDGYWLDVLHIVREKADSAKIILTDRMAGVPLWVEALNCGIYDLIAQPFCDREVLRILANACLVEGSPTFAAAFAAS
jgi:DNA-binding NtrC family response regulator